MANVPITDLTALTTADVAVGDTLVIVDVSEALDADKTKKITLESLFGWRAWTPTWTAATTNPVIGNGTLTGRYLQVGKLVKCQLRLVIGSTTTTGTGGWRFDYPVAPNTTYANLYQVGSVFCFNANGINVTGVTQYGSATFWLGYTPTPITANSPFAWAEGDYLEVNFDYEAA